MTVSTFPMCSLKKLSNALLRTDDLLRNDHSEVIKCCQHQQTFIKTMLFQYRVFFLEKIFKLKKSSNLDIKREVKRNSGTMQKTDIKVSVKKYSNTSV